jgi:hypothetical protein
MMAEAELNAATLERDKIERFRNTNATNSALDGTWLNGAFVAARARVEFLTGEVHRLRLLEYMSDV